MKEIPKKEILSNLYSKGYSMKEIGNMLGMATGKIHKYFHIYNIIPRHWGSENNKFAKKKISKSQKGNHYHLKKPMSDEAKKKIAESKIIEGKGHTKYRNGYVYIYYPKHPKSMKDGYVAEHHLVIEENIGRYLKDNEVVHHINKNKIDNKIENLQLMTRSEHTKLHHLERKKEMEMMTY